MADERDRWLDKAAADRLLRGESATPGAEHPARARADRLRAALDALAGPPPSAAAELPGEAAALAAFRAARGTEPRAAAAAAEEFGSGETVVDLSPAGPVGLLGESGPGPERNQSRGRGRTHGQDHGVGARRGRPVRFALAAAVASVAVGGLAAAAGAGLLDRDTSDSAVHAPAVAVTTGSTPDAPGGDDPALVPLPVPATPRGGEDQGTTPGPGNTTGPDGRTPAGSGGNAATGGDGATGTGGAVTGPSANGSTPDRRDKDRSLEGGTDGSAEGGSTFKDREGRAGAVELCRDFRAGKLDSDRREKLVRLAKGLLWIPRYCKSLLDGDTGGDSRGGGTTSAPSGGAPKDVPPLTPAQPAGGGQGADGSLGLRPRR
ncbi:hypothetical protein SAVIM338S_04576 [Streptomyces avidinii]